MSDILYVCCCSYIGICYVLCVIIGYYLYKFYLIRNHIIIIKRYGKLVIIINISIIFCLGFVFPAVLFENVMTEIYPLNHTFQNIFKAINICIAPMSGYIFLWAICTRYWFIYYDFQLQAYSNIEWKRIIDSSIDDTLPTNKWNWFVVHKNTFGNLKHMTKITLFIIATISICSLIMGILTFLDTIKSSTLYNIPIVIYQLTVYFIMFTLWIGFQRNKFIDIIYIYYELKIITAGFGISLVFYALFIVFGQITNSNELLWYFLVMFVGSLPLITNGFASTFYVLYQINKSERNNKSLKGVSDKLTNCLKNDELYAEFMNYLQKELSQELLLSFTELLQFEEYCEKRFIDNNIQDNTDDVNIQVTKRSLYELSKSLPQSSIVFNNDHDDAIDPVIECKMKAHKLFLKYIDVESEYEVNISHTQRIEFINMMQDYNQWINSNNICVSKLKVLFHEVLAEMYHLMLASYVRLIQSKVSKS